MRRRNVLVTIALVLACATRVAAAGTNVAPVVSPRVLETLAHLFEPPAQSITIPNTFVNGTVADASQVNANFTALSSNAVNRNGGTMLGTLNSRALTPTSDATYDLGTSALKYRDGFFSRNVTIGGTALITGAATFSSTTALNGRTYTWPAAETANYFLQTNGSGTLVWAAVTTAPCYGVVVGKTTNYSAVLCDIVEVTSGTLTITLPAASTCTSIANHIGLKNDTANVTTVARTGGDTIDGTAGSFTTNGLQYESYDFVCNAAGNGWMIR